MSNGTSLWSRTRARRANSPGGRAESPSESSASVGPTSRGRSEPWIALLVFAAAILYLWPLRDFLAFNADEGITLSMAQRVLQGQVPYRDFFTFITPGTPYLMALWFKVFGASYVVARCVLLLNGGLFAALTYLLARRIVARKGAMWAAAILVCGCLPSRFFVVHNWDSTLLALISIYFAHRLLETPSSAWYFAVGCSSALTTLTEQPRGAGLVLGLAIAAVALSLPRLGGENGPVSEQDLQRVGRLRPSILNLCAGAAGFAIPFVITFAYFASQHALAAMLQSWLWPMLHYTVVNRDLYGAPPITPEALRALFLSEPWSVRAILAFITAPMLLISVLPLLVLASTLHAIVLRRKASASPALDARVLGGCIFLGIFLSVLSTRRADVSHLVYVAPLFLYLVPGMADLRYRGVQLFANIAPVVAGILLMSFAGFGLSALLPAMKANAKMETRRGTMRVAYNDEVLPYIEKNVPPGAHLYVHPYQALYSYLAGTHNPTRFTFFFPGMYTPDQYQSAIAELAADHTPYILLNPDFTNLIEVTWPMTPAEQLADDPVEDYILKNYRSCQVLNPNPQQVWRFYFMVRTDQPCPEGR